MLGHLLQVEVDTELNLFARNGFLFGKPHVFHLFADTVDNHAALAVRAHQDVVVLALEAELAGKVAGAKLAIAGFDLLLADFTHVAHGVREEAVGQIAAAGNGNHFEHRDIGAVGFNVGNVLGRSLGLDDDGLKLGKILCTVELVLQVIQGNAEAIGNGAKMFFHLSHVVAQQKDAEGGPVVDQNAAVTIEHAAARGDDGNFADAVALRESGVLVRIDDLEFPEAQQ